MNSRNRRPTTALRNGETSADGGSTRARIGQEDGVGVCRRSCKSKHAKQHGKTSPHVMHGFLPDPTKWVTGTMISWPRVMKHDPGSFVTSNEAQIGGARTEQVGRMTSETVAASAERVATTRTAGLWTG